jgi:hypothetical protein
MIFKEFCKILEYNIILNTIINNYTDHEFSL